MLYRSMNRPMLPRRRRADALAEIVGTLMLVVIVVAAATAFAFFVASYQKQLTAEETVTHDKDLENLRVVALAPDFYNHSTNMFGLQLELASLDVNTIVIDGIVLNGSTIVNYNVTPSLISGSGLHGCLQGNPYANATNISCVIDVPPESHVFLSFSFYAGPTNLEYYAFPSTKTGAAITVDFTESSLLTFDIFTSLGNEFVQSFVPPVAIAGLTFVSGYPILDGSNSYQPNAGSGLNVTIVQWDWSVTLADGSTVGSGCEDTSDCYNYSGQEVELPNPFDSDVDYAISLTVVNAESLVGSAEIFYQG